MSGSEPSDLAEKVLRFADALPGPYGFEASIKCLAGRALVNRFLVTFPKVAMELGVDLPSLLTALGFPGADTSRLSGLMDEGDMVHLGLEEETLYTTCKIYVENAARTRQLWESDLSDLKPVRVHRALKWRPGSRHSIETCYDWLPCSTIAQLQEQIEVLCPGINNEGLQQLLLRAEERVAIKDLQLLRVTEDSSGRRSFDLNLYDACCTVAELLPILGKIFSSQFPTLIPTLTDDKLAQKILGHLAAGVGRDGSPFVTLYYGGEQRGSF